MLLKNQTLLSLLSPHLIEYGGIRSKNGAMVLKEVTLLSFPALHGCKKATALSLHREGLSKKAGRLTKKAQSDISPGPVHRTKGGHDVDWKCSQIA